MPTLKACSREFTPPQDLFVSYDASPSPKSFVLTSHVIDASALLPQVETAIKTQIEDISTLNDAASKHPYYK